MGGPSESKVTELIQTGGFGEGKDDTQRETEMGSGFHVRSMQEGWCMTLAKWPLGVSLQPDGNSNDLKATSMDLCESKF